MESQQSTQAPNDQFAELGQRMARMETKMDFVATHKDIAEVRTEIATTHKDIAEVRTEIEGTRTEIEGTRTEIASLKGELLTEIAGIKTLIANREASMQRWLLGMTSTTMVAITAVLIRTLA